MIQFKTYKKTGSPATPFLSLREAKKQCSIEECDTADDELIFSYILAAQVNIEARLAITLTATQYAGSVSSSDVQAGCTVQLPMGEALPQEVTVTTADGQPLPPERYHVDTFNVPGSITFFAGDVPPGDVIVTWYAGHADPLLIPQNIKVAGKQMVAHWYDHREMVADGGTMEVPHATIMLLASSSHNGMY